MNRLIWSLMTLITVVGLSACAAKFTQISPSSPPATTSQVNVTLGQKGEIESVAIQDGTLRVEQGSASVEVPVLGDAGC